MTFEMYEMLMIILHWCTFGSDSHNPAGGIFAAWAICLLLRLLQILEFSLNTPLLPVNIYHSTTVLWHCAYLQDSRQTETCFLCWEKKVFWRDNSWARLCTWDGNLHGGAWLSKNYRKICVRRFKSAHQWTGTLCAEGKPKTPPRDLVSYRTASTLLLGQYSKADLIPYHSPDWVLRKGENGAQTERNQF